MADFDWLGSLIGGAAGYFGNKDADNTTTTSNTVAPEFQPLANAVAQRGMEIGNLGYTPYGYNRTADFNPYQYQGFDMIANQAANSQLPQQAQSTLGDVLGGTGVAKNQYSGANPYLEQNIDRTLGDITRNYNQNVAPQMAATAYKSGSFGNVGQQEMESTSRDMLQRNLGATAGNMRMQDYGMQQQLAESGLNRMMQGLNMAPSVYGLGYQPAQAMLGIGGAMQTQGQNVLDSMYGEWQDAQNWPFKTYDAMMAPFGRASGGQTTTTQPGVNPLAGALGGAMYGNTLWKSIFPSSSTGP